MVTLLFSSVLILAIGSFWISGATLNNLHPLFAPGKTPLASVLLILSIIPMAYVDFDAIPYDAEEFEFSLSQS